MQRFDFRDFESWERRYRANFFNSLGGYKSLNLLATQDEVGRNNLAPFFSVIHVGSQPPLLGMLFRPHSVPRHTLQNFRASGKATLNAVHPGILAAAHQSSATYLAEFSEFAAVGLRPKMRDFAAPFVGESRLQAALTWREEHLVQANQTIFLVAKIEAVYMDNSAVLSDGLIDHSLLESLAVNGLNSYYRPQREIRYHYAKVGHKLKTLPWQSEKS